MLAAQVTLDFVRRKLMPRGDAVILKDNGIRNNWGSAGRFSRRQNADRGLTMRIAKTKADLPLAAALSRLKRSTSWRTFTGCG